MSSNKIIQKMQAKQLEDNTTITTTAKNTAAANDSNGQIDEEACCVCFKPVTIYSIGECDHPVCYECSTRMRVLCQQNECPICRQVLAKVIFTCDKLTYRELETKNRSEFYNKKYKIGFATQALQQAFFKLLDHPCPKCNTPPYRTFQGLRNHVRKEHDMHYCDLCIDNLKIFTFERRCYTSAELGLHRTKGDADNRSHRGHPLCEYCNKRFLDRDELFRHLRREHYFCHFCEADGCNEFYKDYDALADHFRQDHYLCEEGKCATEQFIGAFRSEIDYKAHVANVHGKTLNKQQNKQTRTLQLEITLGPRGRAGQPESNMRSRAAANEDYEETPEYTPSPRSITIDAQNEQDFPSLGGGQGPSVSLVRPPPILHRSSVAGLARTKENFPALGNSNDNATTSQRTQKGPPISAIFKKPPATVKSNAAAAATASARQFAPGPPLPPPSVASNSSGMILHVSNRPTAATSSNALKKASTLEFPALPISNGKASTTAANKKAAARALLEEDMGTSAAANVPTGNVAAKHRTLVDDYVSVANPNNFHKLQMVQKEELDRQLRREQESKQAPKLTSHEFPTLGGKTNNTNSSANANSGWVKLTSDKKLREAENRNNKVAPAPILNNNNNNKNKNATMPANKKDKKQKDKKAEQQISKSSHDNHEIANGSASQAAIFPPPGFSDTNINTAIKPPPGFHSNVTVNSVLKPTNNLTFTSSLGESYSIVPQHMYITPQNAVKRIQKLDKTLEDAVDGVNLTDFCKNSRAFRAGAYKAPAYYDHCRAVLGDKFDKIFPEFLALLPDINKQQALYLEHKQRLNNMSASERKSLPRLEVCGMCKQVLTTGDLDNHKKMHELRDNFPTLNATGSNQK